MSIQDKIAALPEWSGPCKIAPKDPPMEGCSQCFAILEDNLEAALARLALAREWIRVSHSRDCDVVVQYHAQCTCASSRDDLLAALEPPK